ncbi:MAG TPA: PAS domain-containing protein [Kineosporiaceae bacterium]
MYHLDRDLPARSATRDPHGDPERDPERDPHGDPERDPHGESGGVWRDVVEAMPGFVMLLNADYVCTYVSPAAERDVGLPAAAVIGDRPEALVHPGQLPDVWRVRAAAAAGERAVTTRVRVSGHGDADRWYEAAVTQLRDPQRQSIYSAVHVRDVTAEVESQAALTRCSDRYRCLLAAIDEAVLQLDARGRIESFNAQALELVRRSADELLGAQAVAVLDLRDRDGRPVTGPLSTALAEAPDDDAPAWRTIRRGDGQRRLVRITTAAFEGPRPHGGGTLLILCESGGRGGDVSVGAPTLEQARSAAGLTAREGDVLNGLAAGGDVPTIARQLGISVHSVRGHVKSITAKLGVHSQLQAVIAAAQRGMIDLSVRRG